MPRLLVALLTVFGLVGPLAITTAQAAWADDDAMHCDMQAPTADADAVSATMDCCDEGCASPACCRLNTLWRISTAAADISTVVVHATLGFQALPDAPRAAHTLGIERPPKA